LRPAGIVRVRVGVHGPAADVENCPFGELELSVTVTGAVAICGMPALVSSASVIGPEGAPAGIVCGAVVNASAGAVHVRNDFHASVKVAPARSPAQFWPAGPHAPAPGLAGSTVSPESRIADESRSRIAAVCELKSVLERPDALRGCQAKPKWSCGCPLAAP
jgi:hypothetical protein